jgi:ligand-binding sensor domain-containing protein
VVNGHWRTLRVLVVAVVGAVLCFSVLRDASAATKLAAADVGVPAIGLPEFKTDPHVRESEGYQISGVVRTIFQDRHGNLWFGTQDGLQCYDGAALIFYDLRDAFGKGHTVKAIAEDRDGHIWIATTGGLFEYDREFFTRYTVEDGLASDDVWSVYVDGVGTVWIGTYAGAQRRHEGSFKPLPIPAATVRDDRKGVWGPEIVWSIGGDSEGRVWFVAESGVYRYDADTLVRVPVMDQGAEASVSAVLEDRDGAIWFATRYTGLIRYDGKTFTNISRQAGLQGTGVGTPCLDRIGNVWVPVQHVGVYRWNGKSFTLFDADDGLETPGVFCVYQDHDDRIWCGGWLGAYRYEGTSFVNVTRNGPW